MSKAEDLEKKIEEKKAARAAKEETQYEKDLEAQLALYDEHPAIASVKVSRFVEGQPTMAILRAPTAPEYKRYKDLLFRYGGGDAKNVKKTQDAQDQLGMACWVYPAEDSDEQKAMRDAFPGIVTSIAVAAAGLAEGKADEEGKG